MFCPKCSERKAHDNTQYCTKCGLDLTSLNDFVNQGGIRRPTQRKGIERGVQLIVLGILLMPIWLFIGSVFPPDDMLVESSPSSTWLEQLAWIAMWILFIAGSARIVFALAFEAMGVAHSSPSDAPRFLRSDRKGLPDAENFRPADPGIWRTTDEIFEPVVRKSPSGELR